MIIENGIISEEVESRIRFGKAATRELLWNKDIREETTRTSTFHSILESSNLYGSQSWLMIETIRIEIRTVELDIMRPSLQITR